MVSTVYKGDLSEVTFGKECGLVLAHGGFGGLQFAVDGSDRNKINFSGASEGFFDSGSNLRYPKGMLVGSELRIIGSGSFNLDDYATTGNTYTIVENRGTTIILDRDLHLVRRSGARYHVAHISTRAAIESVRCAKAEGLAVTADTAPPYFLLNELALSTYDTAFKLSPPLRSEDDRQAVIEGLADGTIDAVASDHMPVDRDAKTQPFGPAAPGASGVDTLLALTLTLVHQNHISLSRAIELLSLAPSTILDIEGGTLMPGAAANFILFRPNSSWIIKGANFASNSRITPFESHPVQGVVDCTYIDGAQAYPPVELT